MKWLMLPDDDAIVNINNIKAITISNMGGMFTIKLRMIFPEDEYYIYDSYNSKDEAKRELAELYGKLTEWASELEED